MIYLILALYFIPILICCIWARIDENFITDEYDLVIVIMPIANWCMIWNIIVNSNKIISLLFKIITGRDYIC